MKIIPENPKNIIIDIQNLYDEIEKFNFEKGIQLGRMIYRLQTISSKYTIPHIIEENQGQLTKKKQARISFNGYFFLF